MRWSVLEDDGGDHDLHWLTDCDNLWFCDICEQFNIFKSRGKMNTEVFKYNESEMLKSSINSIT